MRRRCREAFRLNRALLPTGSRVDIAFIYVGKGLTPYSDARRSVCRILGKISEKISDNEAQ